MFVRRRCKSAENAAQRKKIHLEMKILFVGVFDRPRLTNNRNLNLARKG
jgi:hypothetical protein